MIFGIEKGGLPQVGDQTSSIILFKTRICFIIKGQESRKEVTVGKIRVWLGKFC